MTNSERDTLLINLATSVNNLQQSFNDFRIENREEHKMIESSLRAEIKQVAENAHSELKQTEKTLTDKIDQVAENAHSELKQTEKTLMAKIELEAKATSEIIHDTWARQRKSEKRLDIHEKEIKSLKSKLA